MVRLCFFALLSLIVPFALGKDTRQPTENSSLRTLNNRFAFHPAVANGLCANFPVATVSPAPVQPLPYFISNYGFLDFSPDRKYVLTSEGMWGVDEKHWMWNTWFSPDYRFSGDRSPVRTARFTPDGKHIVAWRADFGNKDHQKKVWVLKATSGQTVSSFDINHIGIYSMAFSPDSKKLFLPNRGLIEEWNLAKGKKEREIAVPGGYPMTISPDGKYLFSGGQKGTSVAAVVGMSDLAAGKLLWQVDEHICHVSNLGFSPDGKHALSAGDSAFVYLHEIKTGKVVQKLQVGQNKNPEYPLWSAHFDKTGTHVLVGNDEKVTLWNLESNSIVARFDPKVKSERGSVTKWFLLPGPCERALQVQSCISEGGLHLDIHFNFTIVNLRNGEITEKWRVAYGERPIRLK